MRLYIPLHVKSNRWALLKVDLLERTFMYTDSLFYEGYARTPRAIADPLQRWLCTLLPGPGLSEPDQDFAIPKQEDRNSYGVIFSMHHGVIASWI